MKKTKLTEQSWQNDPWVESLASALCMQRTKADMKNFLRDLATLPELQAFAERLECAKHLTKGKSYRQVAEVTGASTTTVTRVAKFLADGAGGYAKHFKMNPTETTAESLQGIAALQERQRNQQSVHAPKTETGDRRSGLRKFL